MAFIQLGVAVYISDKWFLCKKSGGCNCFFRAIVLIAKPGRFDLIGAYAVDLNFKYGYNLVAIIADKVQSCDYEVIMMMLGSVR